MQGIALGVVAALLLLPAPPAAAQSPGVTISSTNLTIQEGATGSYTVVLSAQPTDTVTISVTASDDPGRCHDASGASCTRKSGVATVDKSSLTFTTTDWNTAQTVTVTATDEDMAGVFKHAKVEHEASGGGYDSVFVAEVLVTVTDDDVTNIVYEIGSPGDLEMNSAFGTYEGSAHSYYVSLTSEPTAATTVALASEDISRVTVSPDSLTFSTTNWNVAQPVSFSVADNDVLGEARVQVRVASTISGTGSDYDGQSVRPFTVNVYNNDIDPGTVNEGDSFVRTFGWEEYPAAYLIRSESVGGAAAIAPASVRVTEDNYERIEFTVTGVDTDLGQSKINLWIGNYLWRSFLVTVLPAPTVTLSASPNPVREGSSVTVTAQLSAALPHDVTIPLTLTAGTAEADDYGSLSGIAIAAGSTSGTGTISTSADEDTDFETFTVALDSLPSLVRAGTPGSVEVTIWDNQAPAFAKPSYEFVLSEKLDGRVRPVALGAVLAADPDGDEVTCFLASGDATRFEVGLRDGTVTYVGPGEDYETEPNQYELTVLARDSHGAEATVKVAVKVMNVNEAPEVAPDTAATDEDHPVTVDVLANDSDVDGDPLRVESVSRPAHGTARIAADGGVVYAPEADWHGTDRFAYTAADGNGATGEAEVLVRVAPVNDAPVAVGDSAATDEDHPVTVEVLANDSDVEGDPVHIESVSQPAHGTARIAADGGLMYAPEADWHGTDRFAYTVADAHGATSGAEVQVRVAPVNDAPMAVGDTATTDEDRAITVDVLANDSDVDGDAMRVESVTQPAHGTARIAAASGVVYAPEADWHGTDRFAYTVADGNGGAAKAEVEVRVGPVNDGPLAVGDTAATDEDHPVTVDVLANDSDVDGEALHLESVSQPAHGTARIATEVGVVYAPEADWHGTDRFVYTVADGNGGAAKAEVEVRVAPVNDAPVAVGDTAATDEDHPVTVDVLANDSDVDGDAMRVESVSRPAHGAVRITAGGGVVYAPEADWHGTDRLVYMVVDGNGGTAKAEVEVRVAPVNDAPVAVGDTAATEEDQPVNVDVLANDSDVDGDVLRLESVSQPAHGTARIAAEGRVVYAPEADWHGTDRFVYTVADANGGRAKAEVEVRVEPLNDGPLAVDDTAATHEDQPVTVDVLANDSDVDGDALRVESVSQPGHGTARIAAEGGVVYAPEPDWHGTDRFAYTVADGNGAMGKAEVEVRVAPVNDAPVALGTIPDQTLAEAGAAAVLDLAPYFEDPDGDPLRYTATSSDPDVASVTLAGPLLTVMPVGYGPASVKVTARDPGGLSAAHAFAVDADDRMGRLVLDETLAAMARAHLASARMTLGRRVEPGGGDEQGRLTLGGRSFPLDVASVRTAAERQLAGWAVSRYLSAGVLAEAGRKLQRHMVDWAAAAAEGRAGSQVGPRDPTNLPAAFGVGSPGGLRGPRDGLGDTELAFAWGSTDGGGQAWQLWAQGDISTFAGESAANRGYEGDLRTGWAGLDRVVRERWLAGVAIAKSKGGADWRANMASGRLETSLTALHPYLRWSDGTTSVWAMTGGGRGSAENTRATGHVGTSNLNLGLGLLEVRRRFADRFGLRADAAWARLATGKGRETVDGHNATVDQQRLGIDWRPSLRVGGVALQTFGEASARRDGGAGQTGAGIELAGGLSAVGGRVRVEAQGRILALHSARGYEERGLGVTLTFGSPSDEEGLSLSVSPRWGGPSAASGALWEERVHGPRHEPTSAAPWSLDAQARWALRLPGGRLLAWFGSLDRSSRGWGLAIRGGIELTGRVGQVERGSKPFEPRISRSRSASLRDSRS